MVKLIVRNKKHLSTLLIGFCLTFISFGSWASSKYMVTFKESKSYEKIKQHAVLSENSGRGLLSASSQVLDTLDHLNTIVVESESDLNHLSNHPDILSVEKDVLFPLPEQVATFDKRTIFRESPLNKAIEMPWGIKAVRAPAAWATTKASGVKVMVIDTGIDKDHPSLSGRFIAGKNFYPRNPNKPQPPYDYFDDVGHGTHVAGSVLADGLNNQLVGVAPEADLYVARVCSSFGCSTLAIVQAINWAIDSGVDVLNLSLGGPMTTKTQRAVYKRAEQMGVTVIAASGNSAGQPQAMKKECRDSSGTVKKCYVKRSCRGPNGSTIECVNNDPTRCSKGECSEKMIDIISFPAGIETVVAVGALSEDLKRATFSQFGPGLFIMAPGVDVLSAVPLGTGRKAVTKLNLGDDFIEVPSNSFQGSSIPNQPIVSDMVFVGLGKKEDFKAKNVQGKFALIKRGEITFVDKVQNAISSGATGVIIFNHEPGLIGGALTDDGSEVGVPVVMIELAQGEKILAGMANKSIAPVASLMIEKTDHSPFQGTSMASPHVCGVAALVLGANPSLSPAQVRTILAQSSTQLGDFVEYGNGLVNSEAAVMMAMTMVGEQVLQANNF